MSSSLITHVGEWRFENFADNHYKLTLKNENVKYLILQGYSTETTSLINVPFSHRLVRIILRQTDNTNATSEKALDVQLRREVGDIIDVPLARDILRTATKIIHASTVVLPFGDGYEYEPTTWTLAVKGYNTNRVHPLIYIQRIGKWYG